MPASFYIEMIRASLLPATCARRVDRAASLRILHAKLECTSHRHFSAYVRLLAKKSKSKSNSSQPIKPSAISKQIYQSPSAASSSSPFSSHRKAPRGPFPFLWSLTATGFAASIGYVVFLFLREPPADAETSANNPLIPQDVSDRYHTTAATFDSSVDFFERIMLLNRRRKQLARLAHGHVLEVSAGTGRNLAFYDFRKVKSLTLLDQAGEMLQVAKGKVERAMPAAQSARVRFVTQSAFDEVKMPEGGFDVVLQTMGVCSTGDPVGLVRKLGGLVKKDTGVVVLLEHGRARYDWLNRALDRWAPQHADKHGCWWNREIGQIVEESGLEVVKMKRYHLGTTWWIELRPRREEVKDGDVKEKKE